MWFSDIFKLLDSVGKRQFKELFKGPSRIFGLWNIIKPKIKQKNYFLDISWSSLHCFKFFSEKRIHNTSQIRGQTIQRQQDSWKTKLNLSIFVWNGSYISIQNHILKKQNAMNLKFTHFPVIKNTIKRIEFNNAYESSIICSVFFICQHSCRINVLCAHFLYIFKQSR